MVDPYTGTPYPGGGGGSAEAQSSFTLEGEDFAPWQGATLYLDGTNGQTIGSTNVSGTGTFQTKFMMPDVTGTHTLVVVQVANARTLQPKLPVFIQELPH